MSPAQILGVITLTGCYGVMGWILSDIFFDHVTSDRRPYSESSYWVYYSYKKGWRCRKRTYLATLGVGIIWPIVFVYGLILMWRDKL